MWNRVGGLSNQVHAWFGAECCTKERVPVNLVLIVGQDHALRTCTKNKDAVCIQPGPCTKIKDAYGQDHALRTKMQYAYGQDHALRTKMQYAMHNAYDTF
jgi:hypothetical protein